MKVSVDYNIPDDIAAVLQQQWGSIAQKGLEGLAVMGYNSSTLTMAQIGNMLGHTSRWETEDFLHANNCYLHYDEADLSKDIATLKKIHHSRPQ